MVAHARDEMRVAHEARVVEMQLEADATLNLVQAEGERRHEDALAVAQAEAERRHEDMLRSRSCSPKPSAVTRRRSRPCKLTPSAVTSGRSRTGLVRSKPIMLTWWKYQGVIWPPRMPQTPTLR